MAKREPLDARTLRWVARRLRARRALINRNHRLRMKQGIKHNPYSNGRAAECDLQADNLLIEARRIERAAKATKLTPATTLCGPHDRARKRTP